MFFSKSIAFDEEELGTVALAAGASSVRSTVEAEFVEKLKSGDAKAFDLLVTRYAGDIYAVLFRITEDVDEANDLTQETFLRAFKAIEKFRGEADLKTWLTRIAINESRNRFRWWKRRRRENTFSLDASIGDSEMSIHETMPGRSASPEENVLQTERGKVLSNALAELPQIYREAVVLCDVENLSYMEIALALNTTMGTVKSRIARGREELRRKLKDI